MYTFLAESTAGDLALKKNNNMKFINSIDHLKRLNDVVKLIESELPNVDFRQVNTYLEGELDVESNIAFFDAEVIPGDVEMELNGLKYINLFPLVMLQEMVEAWHNNYGQKLSDYEIAKGILKYRINDA